MKVRIVSDGSPTGTRVENAETGELLQNVREASFSHDARDIPRATIKLLLTEFDVTIDAETITICPACKAEITSGDQEAAISPLSPGDPLQLPDEL